MKTTALYKLIICCILFPVLAFATPNKNRHDDKHKESKTINKTFTVKPDATLKVDNRYGNIDIVTWEEQRIVFEITITTSGNDFDKVKQKLDNITVEFSGDEDFVTAITKIKSKKSSSWWNWGNNDNVNMKINYVIKMPITNAVDLSNDYGNITLDKLEGRANINCDYGKITTKELLADNNTFNFNYSSNCYFDYIKSGRIKADYSGFTVAKANDLDINADYTKSKIEIIENLTYHCDYGSIKVEKLNSINGNGNYLTTILGDVYQNVTLEADYGSIKIENLTKSVKYVDIVSDYVGIKLGYSSDWSFDFDIQLEYGSLRHDDQLNITTNNSDSGDKYYRGYYNTEHSGNSIKINSDYGSVTFNKK